MESDMHVLNCCEEIQMLYELYMTSNSTYITKYSYSKN